MSTLRPGRRDPEVPTSAHDRYFDYCLQPYEPLRSPVGKLRGESLLWASLDAVNGTSFVDEAISALAAHAGRDATVWGVKHDAGRIWLELYLYDPTKESPRVTVSEVARALAPWLDIRPKVSEQTPYFMFSLDVAPSWDAPREVDAINLYFAEPVGQAGRSYVVREGDAELDNYYHFFHPKRDVREVLARIRSSLFVDFREHDLARVLLPELVDCRRVCVAKKRRADAIYYSGIDVDQLLWFLRRWSYPASIVEFATRNRARLDHLRFDVGLDYLARDGAVAIRKTGFYSTV